ncbi:MAG: NifU family protein [Bacteroidetes bacterium]|nr:NifU family protein [Bacteroidota bacterium]
MEEKKPLIVYMEQTPNPNALKYVCSHLLLADGSLEFLTKREAINCPLAYQLFDFTGVRGVFISQNFVTITKEKDLDWWEIQNILREFIRGFLLSGEPIIDNKIAAGTLDFEEHVEKPALTPETQNNPKAAPAQLLSNDEIEKRIIATLDEYVRPAVAMDGGAIDFRAFENGKVTLVLKGSCNGCPSSTVTLKQGIERVLKSMVPGVEEVVAVN